MPRDGTATRERILDSAERLIIDRGFAATTVDAVLADAGTTKGAFFHHFASKAELARSLVDRYAAADIAAFEGFMMRAEAESEDPAEQVIAFVRLFEEAAEELAGMQPGCLYVSYIFEKQLFDDGTNDAIIDTVITCANGYAKSSRRQPKPTHRVSASISARSPTSCSPSSKAASSSRARCTTRHTCARSSPTCATTSTSCSQSNRRHPRTDQTAPQRF